jgi:hypothetical protein
MTFRGGAGLSFLVHFCAPLFVFRRVSRSREKWKFETKCKTIADRSKLLGGSEAE